MLKKKILKYFGFPTLIIVCLSAVFIFQTNSGLIGKVKSGAEISDAGKLKIIFFDVGQGDSSLIFTPAGKKILVDGGPDNAIVQKLGEVLPFYDKKIDAIILSHPHADHVGGLPEVLKRYEVGKIYMTGVLHTAPDYLEFLNLIKEKNIPVEKISSVHDEKIENNLDFKYLYPDKDLAGQKMENLNNSSIVFKLIYVSTTALFMSDFENEEIFVSSSGVKSDILKVGHHGSTNANDKIFLKVVSPIYVVIQVGLNNSFGHPHFKTLYYLKQLGVKLFRTDQDGDVEFISDGQKWSYN
ncbi:MAG: MBL fold metallo-hydrolase [Candidatus Buchananbacteria bacterium]